MPTGIQWTDETWNPIAAFDRETGGDIEEWPFDLRVREFPTVRA